MYGVLPVKGWFRKMLLIMRLSLLFICWSLIQVSASTYSQNTRLDLKLKNGGMKELFKDISEQSEFTFVYNVDDVERLENLNCEFSQSTVEEILDYCLSQTDMTYIVRDKVIIIVPKEESRSNLNQPNEQAQTQEKQLTGTVTDSSGFPLPGVTVVIKGTIKGTITNIDGKYSLDNVPNDAILVFSFVGMKSQEISVSNQSSIDLVLEEDAIGIEEVIAVGYGTMKRSDVNASIVSVNADELVKTASPNFSQMLMGKAAGLTVTQSSAQPGGGISVLIRGAASTGAGNEPLYVIDGFPVASSGVSPGSGNQWSAGSKSPLNDINPNDIESIEVLKDASATAIYGARGSNGVILITTKRGEKGTHVEYNFNTSIQTISKRPNLLGADELMVEQNSYFKEQYLINNGLYPYGTNDPDLVSPFIPRHSDNEISAIGRGTDWYDLITNTGKIQQHNLTIAKGDEDFKSLVSFNYFNQDGVVKTSGIERFSFRLNLDQNITKWWNYGISSQASMVKEKNAALGGGRDATAGIIEAALNYSPMMEAKRDAMTGAWIEDPEQALLNHPLSFLDVTDQTKTKRLLTSVFTNLHLVPELWIKLSLGADIRDGIRQNYFPTTTKYGREVGGDANINEVYREDYIGEVVLNFQKKFNNKHKLLTLLGYSYQNQNNEGNYVRAMGFSSDALLYYILQAGEEKPIVSSWRTKHILASYFTRLQYSFKEKYLFTFTGRVDGSDRFGENNRYAFFPSGAFAWRVIEEDFMEGASWISDLKLRLSAGQVGNENIGNDAAAEYYAFQGRNYYFGGVEKRGVNLAKMANPDLKWETTTEYNLGVDFGIFRNRILGSVDVFSKEVADLLSNRALPHTSVVGSVPWNIGKTQSKGLEVTLNTINVDRRLLWSSTLTFTSYRDRWLERDPKVILQPFQSNDDPLTAIFTLVSDGIKQPGEETPTMPDLLPGQQKFKDINGLDENGQLIGEADGVINQADVVYMGNSAPKFTLGLNNSIKFEGFDLNCFMYASVGGYKWSETRMEHSVYGSYGIQRLRDNYNFLSEVKDRWTSDNMETNMPSGEVNSYGTYGLPYWQKASYIRVKSISLGYKISDLIGPEWSFDARLYIDVQNLLTITDYDGLDPEVENDRAAYPQQRTFSLGIGINF